MPSDSKRKGVELNCVAGPNGVYVGMYICDSSDLEARAAGCSVGANGAQVTKLYLTPPSSEYTMMLTEWRDGMVDL